MYTDKQLDEKIRIAEDAKLSGRELLSTFREMAKSVCNGIGPSRFPKIVRAIIGFICPSLVIVADIHDLRYQIGGTEADRLASDKEFDDNARRMAEYAYKSRFMQRLVIRRGLIMYVILVMGGEDAFNYTDGSFKKARGGNK